MNSPTPSEPNGKTLTLQVASVPAPISPPLASGPDPLPLSPPLPFPAPDPHRKSRNKIAQLPRELRALVNNLLADGATAQDVVQKLGEHDVSIGVDSVYSWFHGPHQLWLSEQRLLEESLLRHELTLDAAGEPSGGNTFKGAQKIAAGLIAEAVARFGPETLRTALQSDPMNFFRAIHALARLTAGDARYEQLASDAADRQLKLQLHDKSTSVKKAATRKTLEEVKSELNLL